MYKKFNKYERQEGLLIIILVTALILIIPQFNSLSLMHFQSYTKLKGFLIYLITFFFFEKSKNKSIKFNL